MFYSTELITPLGTVTLASDGDALCGLWFHGQKYFAASISGAMHQKDGLRFSGKQKLAGTLFYRETAGDQRTAAASDWIGIQTERLEDFM